MSNWKEILINDYVTIDARIAEHLKALRDDVELKILKRQREKIADEIREHSRTLTDLIEGAKIEQISIKDQLREKWDITDKTFGCKAGSVTIRTTRALKVINKEKLINTLQHIGKLSPCIKGWDLTYLRKLADVGMLNVATGEADIVHYDEKRAVIISDTKNGEGTKDEE